MDAINIITEIYKQELDKLKKENEELKSTDKIDK